MPLHSVHFPLIEQFLLRDICNTVESWVSGPTVMLCGLDATNIPIFVLAIGVGNALLTKEDASVFMEFHWCYSTACLILVRQVSTGTSATLK
jgi:predicted amino acid racemase